MITDSFGRSLFRFEREYGTREMAIYAEADGFRSALKGGYRITEYVIFKRTNVRMGEGCCMLLSLLILMPFLLLLSFLILKSFFLLLLSLLILMSYLLLLNCRC